MFSFILIKTSRTTSEMTFFSADVTFQFFYFFNIEMDFFGKILKYKMICLNIFIRFKHLIFFITVVVLTFKMLNIFNNLLK